MTIDAFVDTFVATLEEKEDRLDTERAFAES